MYHRVTQGWKGEIQTSPAPTFGSVESLKQLWSPPSQAEERGGRRMGLSGHDNASAAPTEQWRQGCSEQARGTRLAFAWDVKCHCG